MEQSHMKQPRDEIQISQFNVELLSQSNLYPRSSTHHQLQHQLLPPAPAMTVNFSIHSKIADTLCGEILLCELLPSPVPDAYKRSLAFKRRTNLVSPRVHLPSSVTVKCISLELPAQHVNLSKAAVYLNIDDPSQERRVAKMLIASGGHRHILQHYNHFIEQDTLFLVSEHCAEGDLYQHLINSVTPDQHFDERQSIKFMKQILLGVAFLHSLGIVHRDLSLENVLLRNGECKISDFGLSTDASRLCTERVGKEYYTAPEVVAQAYSETDITGVIDAATAKEYDPVKADVWPLGVMRFIMLTGSPLLPIASPDEKGFSTTAESGVSVVFTSWGLASKISADLIGLVSSMLRVDPDERMSVTEVLKHPVFSTLE